MANTGRAAGIQPALCAMRHPAGAGTSAIYHGGLAFYLAVGVAFHLVCAWRHLADWRAS